MRFADEVKVYVRAGHGGRGAATFRREKYVPYGGPDGGDGGAGGSVIFEARTDTNTLLDLRFHPHIVAKDGRPGGGSRRTGACGEDRIMPVPVGTVVMDAADGRVLGDLVSAGTQLVAARGGRGGRGNCRFLSSTNRAPTSYGEGEEGEELELRLELKLIADVGLVGYPNAGKSTLISKISAARPKIGDYPFTTLVPSLGVVQVDETRSFVVADIPGLIEGASQGVGLGFKFLRHVERTRIFLHLVSVAEIDAESPLLRYDKLSSELEAYDPELSKRPQLIVLTKIDTLPDRKVLETFVHAFEERGLRVFPISAVAGVGLRELIFDVARLLESAQELSGD